MNNQKSPIKAVYLNLILPGLGLAYLGRWGYAALFLFWTPLRLVLGIILLNAIAIPVSKFLGDWSIVLLVAITYSWWAMVMYDNCTTPYEFALEHNRKLDTQSVQLVEETDR